MGNNNSRTLKFIKNSASMFLYQIILLLSGFITPRIMLSCYGSEVNGLVSSVAQFVGYVSLVEAGLSAATVYSLYKPLADKDCDGVSSVVSAAKKFYYKSGYLFLAIITVLAVLYPLFVDMPDGMNYKDILLLVFVSGVSGVVDLFTLAKYRAILTADQKTYIMCFASSAYVTVNVSVIALLSYLRLDIVIVKAVAILAVIVRSLILIIYCKKKYPYIDYNAKPDYSALSKRWDALFQQVLGVIQNGSPIIIITLVCGDLALVSIYAIFNMVIAALNSLLSIFISGLSASFGEVIARGERSVLQKAYSEFESAYYILISVVYSVAFVMIMPFVEIYTSGITDANYLQPLLGFLFVLNGLAYNMKTPQGMLVLSAGLYKETRYRSLLQSALIIIVGVPFAFWFGIEGVLIGLLVSNVYRNIDLLFFIPKNVTGLPVWVTLKKWLIILINAALAFLIFRFVRFGTDGYLSWALLAMVMCGCCVVTNVVSFSALCCNDMKGLFSRVRRLFARNK